MKNHDLKLVRRVFLILLGIIALQKTAWTQVKLGADVWCPFTCDSKIDDKPGIITEVIYQALKSAKFEMKYEILSWARAIKLAESQKLNGLLGAYVSDVPEFLHPERPVITSRDCFYTNSDDNWNFHDTSSLKKRRIGIIKDYSYGELVDREKEVQRNKIFFEVSGDDPLIQNLNKMTAKRIDTILENEMVIDYALATGKVTSLKSAGCLDEKPLYVVFNPKDPANQKYIKAIDLFLKNHPDKVAAIVQKYRTKTSQKN